jgi:hypothetical protein
LTAVVKSETVDHWHQVDTGHLIGLMICNQQLRGWIMAKTRHVGAGIPVDRLPYRNPAKVWNVRVHRNGTSKFLGTVQAVDETSARLAALHCYGVSEEEAEEGLSRDGIYPTDDFDVSLTLP